jgi:predicted nucleic acid-binding Zn finger protein
MEIIDFIGQSIRSNFIFKKNSISKWECSQFKSSETIDTNLAVMAFIVLAKENGVDEDAVFEFCNCPRFEFNESKTGLNQFNRHTLRIKVAICRNSLNHKKHYFK